MRPKELAILSRYKGISPALVGRMVGEKGLFIIGEKVSAISPQNEFLLKGINMVEHLRQAGGKFDETAEGQIVLRIDGVNLFIETHEELFIAEEIFYRGVYNIDLRHPFRFIDVGMNTATASLFFAANQFCLGVDAFELFPQTVCRAAQNLKLNPVIAKKINVNSGGLGKTAQTLELDYFPEHKGSIGVRGLGTYARPSAQSFCKEKVPVRLFSAPDVFQRILDANIGTFIVCKLDCEGSEYEIINSLLDENLLQRIDIFLIEWHEDGPVSIRESLVKVGFQMLLLDPYGPNHGMIYAWQE